MPKTKINKNSIVTAINTFWRNDWYFLIDSKLYSQTGYKTREIALRHGENRKNLIVQFGDKVLSALTQEV